MGKIREELLLRTKAERLSNTLEARFCSIERRSSEGNNDLTFDIRRISRSEGRLYTSFNVSLIVSNALIIKFLNCHATTDDFLASFSGVFHGCYAVAKLN